MEDLSIDINRHQETEAWGGEGNTSVFGVQFPGLNIREMTPKGTQVPHLPPRFGDGRVTMKLWVRWVDSLHGAGNR